VSVEHCFSGLICISSDLGMLLTSDMLEKLMIVRFNNIFDINNMFFKLLFTILMHH